MNTLFYAVDEVGKLITTNFDYESLLLDCKKRGYQAVWITFTGGSGKTINWEFVNINKALYLSAEHKFGSGIKCWWDGKCSDFIFPKKFNKDSDFVFCKRCGKLIRKGLGN